MTTKEAAEKMQRRVNDLARQKNILAGLERQIEGAAKRTETPLPDAPYKIVGQARPSTAKSKYGNKRVEIDGIWFDSILEGKRYGELKWLKRSGEVAGFEMQVTYRLEVNGIHICDYRADFVVQYPDGRTEVEDTKGVETAKFILQKKLMLAVHGIKIKLIRK